MLKLAGVCFILAGCVGWGGNRIMEEQNRIRHLRELIRIIKRIQDEIAYGKHTLPEICLTLSECGNAEYRPYFRQIYEKMNCGDGTVFETVWEQQMGLCLQNTPLTKEEKGVLINMPKDMGMQEEKLQAVRIGQSVDLLVRKCRQAEDTYENKSKMIFSVSVLTGIFLAILLL